MINMIPSDWSRWHRIQFCLRNYRKASKLVLSTIFEDYRRIPILLIKVGLWTERNSIMVELTFLPVFRFFFIWIDSVVNPFLLVNPAPTQWSVVCHFQLIVPKLRVDSIWVRFYRSNELDQFSSFVENFLVIFAQ